MVVIVIIIILKFLFPILYLKFPFAAGWANFILDTIDGDILIPAGLADATYQPIDKLADYVAYIFMFVWGWKQRIRREITVTFLLRTMGQILFFVTNNEIVFFYFPNLLEPLFLIYVTIGRFRGWDKVHSRWPTKRKRTILDALAAGGYTSLMIGIVDRDDHWIENSR